jgi:hypothetical protein
MTLRRLEWVATAVVALVAGGANRAHAVDTADLREAPVETGESVGPLIT